MKTIMTFTFFFMISACTSISLTEKGGKVRAIEAADIAQCKLVTTAKINNQSGVGPQSCAKNATILVQNLVAELGGNAYMKTFKRSTLCAIGGTGISFNVYSCPELPGKTN